jgi:hypothetical protein
MIVSAASGMLLDGATSPVGLNLSIIAGFPHHQSKQKPSHTKPVIQPSLLP